MHGKFLLVMLVGLTLFPVLFHDARAQPTGDKEYVIAVLSPHEGPLRDVGRHHDESVKKAFGLENGDHTITVHDHTLSLHFLGTGDPSTGTTTCVKNAHKAVEEEGAIAILGPVASNCTERVLSEGLEVPVISSLSTMTDLGAQDRWFFRTIEHDKKRLEAFVDTARAREFGVDKSVAIYKEESEYAKGLLMHLQHLVPELDSDHTYQWSKAIIDTTHEVTVTDFLRQPMQDHHHPIGNVFVLGSSNRMDKVMRALDAMFSCEEVKGDPSFVLVGSLPNTNDLPEDTRVIGEAQVSTSRNLIIDLSGKNTSNDLYISTFDASIALRQAIQNVLGKPDADTLDLHDIRSNLRDELTRHSFSSSERGRSVEFKQGESSTPPTTPIYRFSVERHLENLDKPEPWVEIRRIKVPEGHLEGPVVVELIPHGEVPKEVTLQVEGIADHPLPLQKVKLKGDSTRVTFVPSFFSESWFPNTFVLSTKEMSTKERVKIAGLGWPSSYLVAVSIALLGALLYIWHKRQREKDAGAGTAESRTMWTYVDRCAAGLVIAFLIIHVGPLIEANPKLSWIPIPEFGSSGMVNAVVSGLMGGWLGLNPIVGFASGVIGALTPLFQSDS